MDEQLKVFIKRGQLMVGVLIAGVLVFFVGQMMYQSRALDIQNQNQITVSGEGKIYAKPDVALISLGVTVQGSTVADVTKKNTDKMNAVIAVVKALKVDEKDIQTTNYSLTPNYSSQTLIYSMPVLQSGNSTPTIIGYTLEQDMQVKIRDFTKIGDIISQATASGANLVGSLQFTIDNPEQFKDQARAVAIKQAKINAQNLTKESGIDLGKLINVYESSSPYPVMYNSVSKAMGAGAVDSAPVPTVQPGQQEIDVTINLTYQVR